MNQDDFVRRRCVAARFSDAARFHPETVALVDRERQWSYGELDRRTTLLAAELIRRGIGIGDAVGLHLDRSAELCLGMLASHRAGGCYVPLDPAWPEERRRFIAGETDCKVILSVSGLPRATERIEQTLFLDRFDWNAPVDSGIAMPPPDPRRLAYILYTSGSTGVPKGVEIEHAGLANFVHCQIEQFPRRRNFRTTQAARPGFDASGSEIWPALCSGATLYIIPGELLLHPAKLAAWLAANEIDECFLPTPLAELLLEEGMPPGAALRVLRTGGDRLTRKPPADFPAVLVNEYGPTECSIVSHYAVFLPGESASPPPDIGYPLDNLRASIRDGELRLLPDGEAGEICLGGVGLARGYHRRPDLDALAFAADPLRPGERLYRTGDLGIRRPDGRFEFIGRKDFQIKLRGQRIELGEIEQVIAAHFAVAKCVAALRSTAAGAEYLAAYVTLRSKLADPAGELLDLARRKLPAYMVPVTLTVLDAMPLSANGKIDRAALPDPAVPADARRKPETEVGQQVAELWRQLLGGPEPGLGDHFFRSGGDSLKAAEFALELGDRFDFAASAGLLFDHPVLADLAAVVTARAGTGGGDVLTRAPGPAAAEFPATGYQLAQWKLELVSGCPTLNHIVIAIHLEGRIDVEAIKDTFVRLAAENQSLRSGFAWDGHQLRQRVAPEVAIDFPDFDWSGLAPAEREANFGRLVEAHRRTPFKLDAPPLFRTALCRFEENRAELLLSISHLIFDGWSGALVLGRLRGGGAEAAVDRPDYADFAARCQALSASGGDRRGLAAWRGMLTGFRPMPELPFEEPGDSADRVAGRFQFTLPPSWCDRLKSCAASTGATFFTLLQAVLQLQLHKYTGVTDIVTGTAFANRKLRHTEAIVGMFINSLPLRHQFDPEQSFADFVRSFGETVRQALEYGEIPLDAILEDNGLNHLNAPLFPVSLLLQNLPWPENCGGELRVGYDELGSGIAKTDLTFTMEERGGGLDCHVEYRRSRFSPRTVAEFCDAFRDFAETLLEHPDRPIIELDCPAPAAIRSGVYLAGGTGLLPVCGNMLRERGFHVLGVFSADPAATEWAAAHRIPRFEPGAASLARVLRRIPFDYLFSIVNGVILKPEVLALPRRAAINYHDAPLPRYAGLNAVSWAVINREKTFGVTWHRMDAGVDAGAICRQALFPVAPDATALQLSLQCTEAAAAAFSELADDLAHDRLRTVAQDPAERTVYLASDRPFAGAMLDWSRSAAELAALVRGLELGNYDNELALPKFCRNGEVVPVAAAEIVAAAAPLPPPGTVISADASGITVATGDGALKLGRLRDRFGRVLDPALFRVGENLAPAAHFDPARLDRAYRDAARNEAFWVKALAGLEPPSGWRGGEIALPLRPVAGFEPAVIFALFLARLGCGEKAVLPLRFRDGDDDALPAGLLLNSIPLLFEVDFALPARRNAERGAAALAEARARRRIPGDLGLRRRAAAAATMPEPLLEVGSETTLLLRSTGPHGEDIAPLFDAFCRNFLASSDAPLAGLRILDGEARQRQLFDWNRTRRDYHCDTSFAILFAERLAGRADRVAVIAGDRQMSYRELDCHASRIARLLVQKGARPGDTVAIEAVRSLELACGLLGIFKAGCAYIALEPGQFPPERRRAMLTAAEASLLLFFNPDAGPCEATPGVTLLDLGDREAIAAMPDTVELPAGDGGETAYLMFTSGSTGLPKAVPVAQRNLLNHNQAVIELFALGPDDRMLQFGSLSFDLSVEELFPILLAGGTLIFRPGGRVPPSPGELLDFVRRHRITVIDLPTAYWHQLAGNLAPGTLPPSLRLAVIGGEHASPELLKRWRELAPGVRMLNTYGPTECTVIATASEDFDTIGRPIGNTVCYVVDRFLEPCPVNHPGEILIGGSGVAKGYLNDPERTAHAFVPDPFRPGGRVYRSGDLGCHTPAGELICLGRVDRQVKIRGFRVEPESVEAALSELPGVAAAAVAVRRDERTASDVLDGYVTARPGTVPDGAVLRAELARRVPEFMVPATLTVLAAMPLTPTGKIDRRALPAPDREGSQRVFRAPDSPLEMQLTLLFKRLLKLPSVDPDRGFFELGGDSLSALTLCLEVERICKCKLGMEELYANSSVRGLGRALKDRCRSSRAWSSLLLLGANGDRRPLYLIHTTPGDVLGYVNLAGRIKDRPVYAFQAEGLHRGNRAHRSIPEMASHYLRLLCEQQPEGPYYLCGWCFGGIVAYEMACQLREAGESVGFLGLIETWGMPSFSPRHLFRLGMDFLRLGHRGRLTYLSAKLGDRHRRRHHQKLDFIAAGCVGEREQNEIDHLKQLYMVNLAAARRYRMRRYPGEVELICSPLYGESGLLPNPARRWTGLADHLRLREIAGSHHEDILKVPAVDDVAAEINAALAAADLKTPLPLSPRPCPR